MMETPQDWTFPTLEEVQKVEDEAQKVARKAAKKAKKAEKRARQMDARSDQFNRAQQYLGLRSSAPGDPPAVNHLLPVEHPFNKSVLFVCVDVESYEKDHSKITEVGVATLDTRHLIGVAPGVDGEHWRTKINARHFRIREYQHLTNSQFVSGCPDRFEFGTSEFIDLDEAAKYVEACCKPSSDAAGGGVSLLDPEEQRNIVFLGHDTNTDVEYLRQLGFDVHALPNMLETLDSAVLHQFWTKQPDTTSLSKILGEFDIVGWHMHNAGNDAVYTVQAMLGVCVRESTLRGKEEVVKTEEPEVEEEEVWP